MLPDVTGLFQLLAPIITGMRNEIDARTLLESLAGEEITTVTGRPNRVLSLDGDSVIVATDRSPDGQPVPIGWVQSGPDRQLEDRELEVSVSSLGHRRSFVGAVLLTLPGAHVVRATPPRIQLVDPATRYRLDQAGSVNAWWSADPPPAFLAGDYRPSRCRR